MTTADLGRVTPGLYKFCKLILDDGLEPCDPPNGLFKIPFGNAPMRVANLAAARGVLTITAGYIGGVDKVKARDLVRAADRLKLPEGVTVTPGYAVVFDRHRIGLVGRGGAPRGTKVKYSGTVCASETCAEQHIPGPFDTRVEAARAICKALGMSLPGED